jgi:hypothetical protein
LSDSTEHLDTIDFNSGNQAAQANALFAANSIASIFARRAVTTLSLDWGYIGGRITIDGTTTSIANGVVALTNGATNYIQVNRSGVVSKVTGAFDADKLPLYTVVTSGGAVTSYTDRRDPRQMERFFNQHVTIAMADANVTLTADQSLCEVIELTGANSAERDVIVPLVKRVWIIYANTSGSPTSGVRVKGATGAAVSVAAGKHAIVRCDGTNVLRVTADA